MVGPANVTAIIVDKARPRLLTNCFEQLFGLPVGFLVDSSLGGLQRNRSMSWPESELLRAVNLAIRDQGVEWSQYEKLLRNGAIARLLQSRTPAPAEERVLLPGWAAERATARERHFADVLAASGVTLVGDVEVLAAPVTATATADVPPVPADVPLDAATEALAGLLSAAVGRGAYFEVPAAKAPKQEAPVKTAGTGMGAASQGAAAQQPGLGRVLAKVSTKRLVGVVAGRVRRKAARLVGLGRR